MTTPRLPKAFKFTNHSKALLENITLLTVLGQRLILNTL